MTSKQRMLAAMRFEKVDRVPVTPWSLGRVGMNSPLGAELLRKTDPFLEEVPGGDPILGSAAQVEKKTKW